MSQSSARVVWMQKMIAQCFDKGALQDENIRATNTELTNKCIAFLKGQLGKTLVIYYQKPMKLDDKQSEGNNVYLVNDDTKGVPLQNRACFFIRMIPDGKEVSFQSATESDVVFGEISSDAIIGMNKVIYNFLGENLKLIQKETGPGEKEQGQDEWGNFIKEEQKQEFKKVLVSFAKDMYDTVESLIRGVKFQEPPPNVKEYLSQQDKKDFFRDEDKAALNSQIEEIYSDWIAVLSKEIEDVDKENPNFNDSGPKSELEKWKYRMQRLTKVNDFFKSQDYKTVQKFFYDQKNKLSTKIVTLLNDMKQKRIESHTAHSEARDNVKYLSTLEIYFDPLYNGDPDTIIDSLQSLMNSLKLISFTARYYDSTKMTNLFSKITTQMITNCTNYILDKKKNPTNDDPNYLWNQNPDELIKRFEKCIELYKTYKQKYKDAKTNTTSSNRENNFEFGENQLFGKFDQFCKRLFKLIELFTTIKQFDDIKAHKLDSMENIQSRYEDELGNFRNKTTFLLHYTETKFDKDYVAFNLQINDIENELHKIIGEEFKKLNWIEKKLNLLARYEKILTKPNLQQNLKSEKLEIFTNYKREIDLIQATFDTNRTNPKLQRNMPKISGRIKWAKHLFDRIFPFIHNFRDISAKDRKETELSYMTTNTILQTYVLLNEKFFGQFVESVKPKLTLPLLVINENSSPKVNLDLYVLQLIREAKCMLRMNCEIPEAAKIILLQEEKYKRYYNELTFMVKEYNRILSRINRSVAEYYFKGHIKDLNLKLTPLKSTINWSSMNIESSLNVVFQCLQRFEYSIDSFMEILDNRVHRNMLTIRKLDLLMIPENPTLLSIPDIISKQEAHVAKQNEFLKNKNNEIENAILDMINGIKSYEIDPKITKVESNILYKLITDYEDKFYEFLIATTKNSLMHLKDRINGENSQPIFSVEVILASNKIDINPKINLIQEAINKIAKSILYATKNIMSWKKQNNEELTSFHEKVGKDNEIVKMILVLTGSFQANNVQIENYLKQTFDVFKPIWTDSIEKKIKEFNQKKNKTYFDYEEKLNEYHKIEENINAIPDIQNIGAIALNLVTIKESLNKYTKDWKTAYMRQLLLATKGTSKELNNLLDNFEEKLGIKVHKMEELKDVVEAIEEIRINEGSIEDKIKPFVLLYGLAKKYLKDSDFERYNFPTKDDFEEKWKRILVKAGEIRDELQKNQLEYKKRLYADALDLKNLVEVLRKEYEEDGPVKCTQVDTAFDKLDTFRRKVQNLKKYWGNIKSGEKIFNVTPNNYPDLQEMEEHLKILGTLYDLYKDLLTQVEEWKDWEFNKLYELHEEMSNKATEFGSRFLKVNKSLESNQKYTELKQKIEILKNQLDVFELLTNDKLEDYHFVQMAEYTGIKELATTKSDGGIFKLKLLFDGEIQNKREDIEDTCKLANIQRKVRDQLNEIEEEWKTKEFKFEQHKTHSNIMLLDPISSLEIKEVVEEHAGKVAGFKSQSRNLTDDLRNRIKQKELQFQTINSTLDLWLQVQQLWNSLQSFFIGGDIRKELPGPTKNFENCHKLWIKIMMDKAYPLKKVMDLCGSNELTPDLQEIDRTLKECQQKLDLYLEGKRGQFPRFYFVSNSVLLDILSKRSDPANIRSNLGIIFDAVNDIEFEGEEKKIINKIKQVKNANNPNDVQLVDMSEHPVKCDGKIEEWLGDLVKSMQLSLRDLFEKAYNDVKPFFAVNLFDDPEQVNSFRAFILKYICQVVLFGLQLFGTKRLEEFIVRTSVTRGDSYKKKLVAAPADHPEQQDESMRDFNAILMILTGLCRENNPNKLAVVKLEALIIIHVHNLDIYNYFITDKDMARQIVTVNDYEWLKQTRVYWYTRFSPSRGEQIRTCLINITDVPFEYGYEFLGARERMCITPLTDKCYITLAQAMGMQYGGAPAGPAGTGKTETVKDMGRTMGVFVLVTNCAPEHRYKNMAEIFKGLSQSGAWGCFDEFNRIDLEVLSVLATIIAAIQECRKKGETKFKFPESANTYKDCELIPTMGYFITMNPGYAGRQELPENLKVLFRGVTMMAPNRESIIRVKLCSYGFDHHDDIAKKFRKLYELCEAQLSKQQHYDFGLRNILSVLRHGGNEKKNFKDNPDKEEELIYKALDGMNLSKLVPDDKGLFKNLIRDVFPQQKDAEKVPDKDLNKKIEEILAERKLSNFKDWKEKIIQTYDTYQVRHGFMVVGVTATGKTTIMNVLTEAMSRCAEEKKLPKFAIHRLNPKAVENEYLFIQKIEDNYVLGVFTNIWKKCNESSSPDSKKCNWIVCDGPIDAIWIENLNTVLDDNKILTLSNNERISMQESCRLVMEVENVKNASLATVSRCGMIYITESDITVGPIIDGWFYRNKEIFKKDIYNIISEDDLKKEVLKLVNKDVEVDLLKGFTPCMQVSFLIKVKNFFLLLDALLNDKSKKMDAKYIKKILAFSFAWSVGSFYEGAERTKFHKYLADKKFPMPELKNERTIFECSLDGDWEPWTAPTTNITRAELDNFSALLVPTLDSTRAIFLIQLLSRCHIDQISERSPPCLLLGDAGTAKTSTVLLYQRTFDKPLDENEDTNIKRALKRVNFSSATSPTNFQETVDDELEKSGAEFVPILERNLVIFIDDLSMPYVNKWGDQVTLELVRQLLEFSSYYSIGTQNRGELIKISKISYVAAMNHPKGGKNDIPNRLKRHFFIFNMVLPNNESVNNIYLTFTKAFFNKKFGADIIDQAKELPRLTSKLLTRMTNKFQPTPIKFHYSYNMRELSRTFQGLFKINPDCLIQSEKKYGINPKIFLLCFWKHEVTRVFSDKLRDLDDKKEFTNILDIIFEEENLPKEAIDTIKTDIYFADYLRDKEQVTGENDFVFETYPKYYENIVSMENVKKFTTMFMEILNGDRYKKHVDMVLFDDCLRSLMKITRVIQQDQGSCMLVGVGGSGKQSLTRLAAECEQNIVIQPTYQNPPRQDDLRAAIRGMNTTIIEGYNPQKGKFWQAHTLLMTDAEFKMDYYLEVISSFLSTGEIANLYAQKNDKNAIIASTRTALGKIPKSKNSDSEDVESMDESVVWTKLIGIGRKFIHVCLCFSPSSEKFREKFIKFPILFNNCTIIWLLPWPEEALISVVKGAVNSNTEIDLLGTQEQINNLFNHMSMVHTKISENICKDYYDSYRRHVYVTPKSYLSFIQEYMKIYINKKNEIKVKEDVINTGLAKLKQAEIDIDKENKKVQVELLKVEGMKKEVDAKEKVVSEKNEVVSKIEKEVSAKEEQCQREADEIALKNKEVKEELEIAMPKLLKAKECIVNMEKNVLLNVASAKVAPSIQFYFECSCLIMNKRLAIPDNFGILQLKEGVNAKYYNPTSWTTTLYYLKQQGYGSYFETIKSWQEKLETNDLNINDETLELLRPLTLTTQADGKLLFAEDVALKIGGDACKRIALFCTSISTFVEAVRDVIPKQQAVNIMGKKLEEKMAELKLAQEKKAEVLEEKRILDEELDKVIKERNNAQELVNKMLKKVESAKNLITSLGGEKERWTLDSQMFDKQKKQLLGDSAISSAFIAYAGPFNYTFRKDVLLANLFKGDIEKRMIPYDEKLEVEEFLVDDRTKNEWFSCKLPSDTLSIQNAILVTSSSRFPLLIDPQDQAKNWLVNMYPGIEEKRHIYQMGVFCSKKFMNLCNELLPYGEETIIEGIENEVDSTLDPILEKRFVQTKGGKAKAINFGGEDNVVDYDENFKLFLLCKLINPHFTPELAAKTTIIDFCVTAIGLEQQLQARVISKEQSELEERLKTILEDIRKNKASLLDCQQQILSNLQKPGNLLENEEIVSVLNKSKTQAEENTKKIDEAEEKKKDINQKREKYLPVATRGSVLYFSIVQMQEISKMYSTSLQQFLDLFNYSIDNSIQNPNTEIRVKNIIKKLTEHVYKYIVRGLFEKHKTAFILLVCFKILTEEKIDGSYLLKPSDISFFIKCGGVINTANEPECPYDFLGAKGEKYPKEYVNLLAITQRKYNDGHLYFQRLPDKIASDVDKLKNFYNVLDAEKNVPYEDLFNHHKKLVAFLKLIFVRALREDRTIICARSEFIPVILDDKHFLDSYSEEIKDLHAISTAKIPILYLLSAGADPSTNIENLAKSKGKHIDSISMGEGQLEVAVSKVETCIQTGDWVYFQNCHLGLDFMAKLDIMLKDTDKEWNPQMRIWLSCEPRDKFPIGLLHQSLKVTNEPPKGIKNGMLKTYSSVVSAEKLDVFEYKEWRNLIFALSFIHSLVIERRKYGALGFCVPYDFNDSDLEASILFVEKQFARESDLPDKKPPHEMMNFKTLTNVVSNILYGGRITDLKDESLFKTIVSSYLEDPQFKQDNYCFYPSTKDKPDPKNKGIEYKIPKEAKEIEDYKNYIKTFPENDPPQVFGLHGSADMTFRLKEFKELIETITDALPKDGAGGGGVSKESEVKPQVITMLDNFPAFFVENDYRNTIKNYSFANIGHGLEVPLNNCLLQEIQDIQNILVLVKKSLKDIKDAIEGTLLMTETITDCIDALYLIKPPKIWMFDANGSEISWLSPSSSSWFEGLKIRCEKLRDWLGCSNDQRPPFYLPGILKPQGFLAAFRQEYFQLIRRSPPKGNINVKDLALDQVDLIYTPDKIETDPKQCEKKLPRGRDKLDTIVIYGLYIEGAIWGTSGSLQDDQNQNSRNTIIQFPLIFVKGSTVTENKGVNLTGPSNATYPCPLYKYPKRTDKYIITDIKLKISGSDQDDKYWQRRGVALLCNKE